MMRPDAEARDSDIRAAIAAKQAGQANYAKEIVAMAVVKEIITRKSAWFYYKDDKWQGTEKIVAEIRGNLTLRDELIDLIANTIDDPRGVVYADE